MTINPTATITGVAGDGTAGFAGNGGPATSAELFDPATIAVDSQGDLFFIDYVNNCVREMNTQGVITTVAGNGTMGYSGDGGLASRAQLREPAGLALDSAGDIFIADSGNNRIREVHYTANYATSTITTVAGDGAAGYNGDNRAPTLAELWRPSGIAVNGAGTLIYIADEYNNRIREVNLATNVITTVAGTGDVGFSGDGGQATAADLYDPWGVLLDSAGNLYITDFGNQRIRKVDASGVITTFAGNGTAGYSGDGGLATAAELNEPWNMAIDAAGNLFFTDLGNNCIREVNAATGLIATVVGDGTRGFSAGGATTADELSVPEGVALVSGQLYVADTGNNLIRAIVGGTSSTTVTVSPAASPTTAGNAVVAENAVPAVMAANSGNARQPGALPGPARQATTGPFSPTTRYNVGPVEWWRPSSSDSGVSDSSLSIAALDAVLAEYNAS
jgi:sugar lactone lactonase YvrE